MYDEDKLVLRTHQDQPARWSHTVFSIVKEEAASFYLILHTTSQLRDGIMNIFGSKETDYYYWQCIHAIMKELASYKGGPVSDPFACTLGGLAAADVSTIQTIRNHC